MEDSRTLEMGFNEKDVWEAICGCVGVGGGDRAPDPDGFNFKFIKKALEIIKSDLLTAVQWFWDKMEIFRG